MKTQIPAYVLLIMGSLLLNGCAPGSHQTQKADWLDPLAKHRAALYDGQSGEKVNLGRLVGQIEPGEVLVLGENHGFSPHHENQYDVLLNLVGLNPRGLRLSVGMEFFPRFAQKAVDEFISGLLPETDFLGRVEWGGGISFDHYRRQVLFPKAAGGTTVALNARRSLTSKIAKCGLDSLTPTEREELPKDFTLGNPLYKDRFREVMGGHVKEEQLERYFTAQSAWDEVMATTACEFLAANPEQTLVVIVGDFHAAYGGGLPDRMKARGCRKVTVVSQLQVEDLTNPENARDILPDSRWGRRGDYVWAVESKENGEAVASPSKSDNSLCP